MTNSANLTHHEKRAQLHQERWELLHHIVSLSCTPMTILSFVWVALVIVNFISGLPEPLQWLSTAIWIVFVLDFLLEVTVAPHKVTYLRKHWLTVISLALPAFSMLRILAALRLVRLAAMSGSFSLLRIVTACNRGMAATRRVLGHRQLGYIMALTFLLLLAGAAGMYAFENPAFLRAQGYGSVVQQGGGLHSYPEALWWTAMLMTTIGSAYWPVTMPGRILSFLLALYALSVFGYITATIASYFIGKQNDNQEAGEETSADTAALQAELAAMREQLAALVARFDSGGLPAGLVRETRPITGSAGGSIASQVTEEASTGL